MSGIHNGIIVSLGVWAYGTILKILIPIGYWAIVSIGLTIFTRRQIQKVYEEPMQKLAVATKKVAEGDFSVRIEPIHESERFDYLDIMIEDFNKMVEELGSIETLKTSFFSNVSHEIKTPLSIIQNNAELLKMSELNDKQKDYADSIYKSSKRLTNLITNILKLNKLENQTITPSKEKYDLCAQLTDCVLAYDEALELKDIDLEVEMEDRAIIEADSELMELVWNNLINNAVKFTEPGGTITICEKSTDKLVEVLVTDTGCGMDEDTIKHIFDKFYQGDSSHSTKGNGLGLALVKQISQINDFNISVESVKDKGSTFTVSIPKAYI